MPLPSFTPPHFLQPPHFRSRPFATPVPVRPPPLVRPRLPRPRLSLESPAPSSDEPPPLSARPRPLLPRLLPHFAALARSPYDPEIFALALPALGTMLIEPILTALDTLFITRLGTTALAAMGPCAAVYGSLLNIMGAVVSVATTVAVTRAATAADPHAMAPAVLNAAFCGAVLGLALWASAAVAPATILGLMGAEGPVRAAAVTYFTARSCAIPASMVVFALDGVFMGLKDTRTPFYVACAVGGVNLVLDPLLMFGRGAVPGLPWGMSLGIAGAAYATAIAQWLGCFFFIAHIWRRRHQLGLTIAGGLRMRPRDIVNFLKTGSSVLVRNSVNSACWMCMASMATRLGEVAVASHQIAWNIWLILCYALDALGTSAVILVERVRVSRGVDAARALAERVLTLAALSAALAALPFLLLRPLYLRWFHLAPPVAALAARVLAVALLTLPLCAVVWTWDAVMYSVQDFAFSTLSLAAAAALAAAAMLLVYRLRAGLLAIWLVMTLLFFLFRLAAHAWRFYRSPASPLALPPPPPPATGR